MNLSPTNKPAWLTQIPTYLKAGLLAGLAAAILNNIIYLIMSIMGGFAWLPLVAVSILVASFLPNLVAALAYFALSLFTRYAYLLLTIGVIAFVLASILPHLGIGPAPRLRWPPCQKGLIW